MIHDVAASLSTIWPRIALVLFVLVFAGIIIWTYRGGRDRFAHVSRLPLDDENASREPELHRSRQ